VQHDQDEMEILFTLLSERYERKTVGSLGLAGVGPTSSTRQPTRD